MQKSIRIYHSTSRGRQAVVRCRTEEAEETEDCLQNAIRSKDLFYQFDNYSTTFLLINVKENILNEHMNIYSLLFCFQQQNKSNKLMRTSQLHNQDKNVSFSSMACQRYEVVKSVSNKRTPTVVKPLLVNSLIRNPTSTAMVIEKGIQENPMSPMEVATQRADRIAKERLKQQVSIRAKKLIYLSQTNISYKQTMNGKAFV